MNMNYHFFNVLQWSRQENAMHDFSFYSAILGLSSQWRIQNVTVDDKSGEIELHISGRKGSKFCCSRCGVPKLPSSVSKSRWLHENHLNIRFYISALVPIVSCEQCGEMRADIPWKDAARPCNEHETCDENHCKSSDTHFLL